MTQWRSALSRVVLFATVTLVTAVGCGQSTNRAPVSLTTDKIVLHFFRNPEPITRFTAQTLDGRTVSSEDWEGKVVLINFWATWCPPCKAEIPDLIALQEKYSDHLQVLGISEDEGSPDAVRTFIKEHNINYPVVMSTPKIREALPGVIALPTSFVIDRNGRIVQKHVGMLDTVTTEYETRALAGLPIDATIELVDANQPVGLANAAQATDIPGVDLSRLSPEKRVEILLRLNAEPCTCGCGLTVAKCRVDDPSCDVSLPLARTIAGEA